MFDAVFKEEFGQAKLVSVIIPVYNREFLLPETIHSVYNQTYRPIECIIVDDGSTDNSKKIIQEFQRKFNSEFFNIKLIEQSNAGAPAARNNGIHHSKGEFIQFLDSDDLIYPDKLQTQVEFLLKESSVDGVYGDWHHGTKESFKLVFGEKWEDTISQFYGGRVIHTLSFLFRRSMISRIGLWDVKLKRNQEVDYFLRAALAGGNFDYLRIVTGLWREHFGERIITSNGAIHALAFHHKWIDKFQKLGLLTKERKKTAAYFLFWHAMDLGKEQKEIAIENLEKAYFLFPEIPEFNTSKIKFLKKILGIKLSLKLWYERAKSK
ncbi:glycosyltransferase family 2 protein [Mongoliitalea lutea]|uniref:Glycosyltransferase 2-like domain-containing protein n=1 Tax=Mongoliitalea lutea TaxID=849756 RepID=A0A8J3CWP3_9BACT|nr:glycosyltransferase family A protein [Mongoliitalea lutea]GHB37176.1 hypothetical protein GCM10008106_18090 [Mongoliitalea lutea]